MIPTRPFTLPNFLVGIVLGMICLLAIYLRVANLDGPDFGIDEILHVYASQELSQGNPPNLPGGKVYPRALMYTWLVAVAGQFGGFSEGIARIPSVVFGMLIVLIVFFMARFWFSNMVGLGAAFFVAIIPVEIVFSRSVRMYTMFQFFYLLLIFLFFYGYESGGEKGKKGMAKNGGFSLWSFLEIKPIVLAFVVLLFFFTKEIHPLVVPAMAGPLAYIFIMAGVSLWLPRVSFGCKVKYGLSVFIVGATIFGVYLFNESWINWYLNAARFVPLWAVNEDVENWRYYRDALAIRYPILFGTFLFGSFVGFVKNPKATAFVTVCFLAPLLLGSVVFLWKAYRYIFHLLPLMFILFSIGFVELLLYCYRILSECFQRELGHLFAKLLTITILTLGVVFLLQSTQWFTQGLKYHQLNVSHIDGVRYNSWREAMHCASNQSNPNDVLITPWPLLSSYYGLPRKTYKLNNHIPAIGNKNFLGEAKELTTLEALQEVVHTSPSGILVSDRTRFFHYSRSIPVNVRNWVSEHFNEIPCPSAADMILWQWGERNR